MQSRFIRQLSRENRETNFVRMEEKGGIFECLLVMPVSKPLNSHPTPTFSFEDKIYKELFKFLKRRTKPERERMSETFADFQENVGIKEYRSFGRLLKMLADSLPLSLKALKYSEALYYGKIRAFVIHA